MTSSSTPFQSRWGFHPCDYEFFLKLKRLHKWYWQTLYDFHRWHRWWRRLAANRIGSEPKCCPAFIVDQMWHKSVQVRGEKGFKLYPRTVVDHGAVNLYQLALRPQLEPVPPFDARTIALIEALYEEVQRHFDP
jgi:hypothetical protein